MTPPKIFIAFRFHGNFYHSYRGDTPDDLGFGKDIRIIRHILVTLDKLNARGIPVRGTWDFENYFSLEKIMPTHCPDIIANLQRRAQSGKDEIQLMSYNNGLISAHTAREFEEAVRRGISNAEGSGLHDLFGGSFFGMVRPQEMMYTPIHLKLYPANGIKAISLFYSALPFNGFSNFVPPLTLQERYNPLTLTYPGIEETMTLIPCYNHGDIADHLTLRRWVKRMRKEQIALKNPQDLLLLIDMDADDEFWLGFNVPVIENLLSTARGLQGLVEDVADLDYVTFTTPGDYLKNHEPVGTLTIGQDTADGSFDGISSWAEKWSNQRLWTGLENARILEEQTRRLIMEDMPSEIEARLSESFEARIKILSTTHFGMAAPVMNLTREKTARALVQDAVDTAAAAFEAAAPRPDPGSFSLMDYVRGVSTNQVQYSAHPSKGLVRLLLTDNAPEKFAVKASTRPVLPTAVLQSQNRREVVFVEHFEPAERKDYLIETGQAGAPGPAPVLVTDHTLQNEFLKLKFDNHGQVVGVELNGQELAYGCFLGSGITYDKQLNRVDTWETLESTSHSIIGLKRMQGHTTLKGDGAARFEREILLAAGLPYIYIRMQVMYPLTPHHRFDRGRALRLQQSWDSRWTEIMPCEISPSLAGSSTSPLRVWKHNYCDHISSFNLDYGRYSNNSELDSINNQVTHGWVAVSDGEKGILVAQNADVLSSMAFCPLRTRHRDGVSRVFLNPFGSYSGRQYQYATADTGLGNWLATAFSAADHIQPYAPSYNGRFQEFSILIAPYSGDKPPEEIQHDAEAFAYPYLVLNDNQFISKPPHRCWNGTGLGEPPKGE